MYEYKFIHKPGRLNVNADALSRNPILNEAVVLPTSSSPKLTTKSNARQATFSVKGRPPGSKNKPITSNLSTTNTEGETIAERLLARRGKPSDALVTKERTKPVTAEISHPKGIQPSDKRKRVTFREDSKSSADDPPAPRQRNSGFPLSLEGITLKTTPQALRAYKHKQQTKI